AVLYALPGTQLKHAFSAVTGLCLVQWIFGPDWIHSFVTAVITYLLCLVLPRKSVGTVAFYFVMAYMTGSHMYRMYISYMSGTFDFTGTQMVLTMKLTSFAYNLGDGGDKMVLQETPHEGKMAKVYADRARFAVRTMPSPLAYLGYVYCFTCILAGPAFEYKDYERAIDGDAYKTKDGSARKPPTLFAGLLRLLVAVLCLGGHLQTFIDTVPYFARYAILMVAMFSDRLKFYFAWKIAEGASILGGFGFEGYTDEGKVKGWKGVENIDIRGFETATCVQSISKVWNKRTQGWLERYTYHRSGRSLTATYFVSAIWHGLYPGFFIMFMTIPLMTNVERLLKSKINPLVVPGFDGYDLKTYPAGVVGWLYWGVCWLCTMAFMNYVVQVFSMGSLENSLTALSGHWFLPHLVLLVAYVLLEVMPATKKVAKDKKA
ncbi:MBOAT, membrane-bound O-acyltransferase family-domain-containing protein, partial [Ochromonadaceae sp. CCMP2298]